MFNLGTVRFQEAAFLGLLLFLPPLIFLWRRALLRKKLFRRDLLKCDPVGSRAGQLSHLSHIGMERVKFAGCTLVLAALSVALARPQVLREKVSEERAGLDGVLLLDVSFSMRAEDIVPSRLAKAKEVIRNFVVQKSPDDRIGLVAFAESSLILSYLTRDPENLLFYMDYLEPQYGTNIGRAITGGLVIFEKEDEVRRETGGARGAQNSRLMILISDGEDHGVELEDALAAAVKSKMKIYTVGVGSRRAVPIPVESVEKGLRKYLTDPEGSQVRTQFNERALREIARLTGGRFYRSFVGHEMSRALDEIIQKEREIRGFHVTSHYEDLYHVFLIGSLAVLCVLLVVSQQ
ncbi:MAG: VWA domain-containing protein [Acidobacteria bacterium]|nr:VWA domain-containing protein [Acidobacteriota bacterium]